MEALRTSAVDPLDVAFEKQLSDQAEQELNELRTENEGLVSILSAPLHSAYNQCISRVLR